MDYDEDPLCPCRGCSEYAGLVREQAQLAARDAALGEARPHVCRLAELFCDKETPARRHDGPAPGCYCDVCEARRWLAAHPYKGDPDADD